MSKEMKKIIIYILSILLILMALGAAFFSFNKSQSQTQSNNQDAREIESLTGGEKAVLNYNYEVPYNFKVLDIASENEILIDDNNKLRVYNLDKEKFNGESIDIINKDHSFTDAKVFDGGIIWTETIAENNPSSKIFIKYFSDNIIEELERCNADILPSISVSSNYITYYIADDNNISVKLFDLVNKVCKTIVSYELGNGENQVYLSAPSTNGHEILWSVLAGETRNIYSYNIEDAVINLLSENSAFKNPVIKGDRIFAIEVNDFYDSELDCEYASDFIVEYNPQTNTWEKFEEDRIGKYIDAPQECVVKLDTNEGPLFWQTTFSVNSIYDLQNKEFISVIKENADLRVRLYMVKDNVIYYEAEDFENRASTLIYIMSDK